LLETILSLEEKVIRIQLKRGTVKDREHIRFLAVSVLFYGTENGFQKRGTETRYSLLE